MNLPPIYNLRERLDANGGDLGPDYRAGAVLLALDHPVPHLDFYRTLSATIPPGTKGESGINFYKKMKDRNVSAPIKDLRKHVLGALVDTPEAATQLRGRMAETDQAIVKAVRSWFPKQVRWGWKQTTWRFTETRDEDIHWDAYSTSAPLVRCFVNLDTEPRVWRVGPLLPDYCRARGISKQPTDDMNKVAIRASKQFEAKDDAPSMVIDFPPGALWLVQSQLVAHQIVRGRRLYALSMEAS